MVIIANFNIATTLWSENYEPYLGLLLRIVKQILLLYSNSLCVLINNGISIIR